MSVGDWRPKPATSVTTRILVDSGNIYIGSLPSREVPERKSQHDSSFGVVWVNGIGSEAMAAEDHAKFPVGSVIVREKFKLKNDVQPELIAVMLKRDAGFNPKGGDWEYLLVDGALTKIRDRQKKGSCSGCHANQKERDFVFPVTVKK